MASSNFAESVLAGKCAEFARCVDRLREEFGFDFVSIGLTAFVGAPLKWVYSAGATGERHKRIALAPGHGIGGIVVKAGKPMMLVDIDRDLDPREYSSYPIVFAEDLRSFCALPLKRGSDVVGVLLCAFRTVNPGAQEVFSRLLGAAKSGVCGMDAVTFDFMSLNAIAAVSLEPGALTPAQRRSELANIIAAQEEERMRISRELHDGVAQELLMVSFLVKRLQETNEREAPDLYVQIDQRIEAIIEELRTVSVTLRPSALDHLGLMAALRSHAAMLEKTYGAEVVFDGTMLGKRFDPAFETQVYRICQEAILNACKYSGSDKVHVRMDEENGRVVVEVRDDGVGFDAVNPKIKGTGCGLPGMRERANLIGAQLDVRSGSEGTVVTVRAPFDLNEEGSESL